MYVPTSINYNSSRQIVHPLYPFQQPQHLSILLVITINLIRSSMTNIILEYQLTQSPAQHGVVLSILLLLLPPQHSSVLVSNTIFPRPSITSLINQQFGSYHPNHSPTLLNPFHLVLCGPSTGNKQILLAQIRAVLPLPTPLNSSHIPKYFHVNLCVLYNK